MRRFREHARDVHDAGELLALADREMVAPLDARRAASSPARPSAWPPSRPCAHGLIAVELRGRREPAPAARPRRALRRPSRLLRLAAAGALVLAHIVATGGIALTDDLLGQFLGQDILRRLSRRLGEGAFNGALTARIGVAAIEVIRPLPFLAAKRPRVRECWARCSSRCWSKT